MGLLEETAKAAKGSAKTGGDRKEASCDYGWISNRSAFVSWTAEADGKPGSRA